MSLLDLTGKVAIVTGSSRGIGRAIAEAYADAGARVVISSRKQQTCDEVAAAINARHEDGRALAISANISDKAALEALVQDTTRQLGPADILVCNAATNPYYGLMTGISDDQFQKVFVNNVHLTHWLVSMVAPDMSGRGNGAIILVSSIGGLIGSDVIGACNISKAADFQLVRSLAVELGGKNVRVNAIAPGTVRTDFAKALWEDPVAEAALARARPLGRIGEPSEIAGAAVFLASRAGSYMTGQSIIVDGGMTIHRDV